MGRKSPDGSGLGKTELLRELCVWHNSFFMCSLMQILPDLNVFGSQFDFL